jgi:hypothetical protein
MNTNVTRLLMIMLALSLLTGAAGATPSDLALRQGGAPQVVSYQGQVTVGGEHYDGTGYFKLAVVDGAGSTTHWSNDGTSTGGGEPTESVPLSVDDGLLNVLLGDTTLSGMSAPLTATAFEGTDRYLRVWFSETGAVGTFTQLTPDQRIAATPYALQAEDARNAWALNGNSGTDPSTDFLGTTDVTSLTLTVNNTASLRLTPGKLDGSGIPNVIGGSASNVIDTLNKGSVIGGGGYPGEPNHITADYATIGGGRGNEAGTHDATVGGGRGNAATADSSTVGGGHDNTAGGYTATVPGGNQNLAQEDYSLAAGRRAQAIHVGAFVWADSTNADFTSASDDEFAVRAGGGVRLETDGAGATVDGHTLLDTHGEAYIIVEVTADPVVNGQNLLAAYAEAKTLTPHGQSLSTSNRAVVLLPPGQYDLQTTTLALDAEYVDLEGLSADRDKQHIHGTTVVTDTGVISQTANDVRLANLFVEITRDSGDITPSKPAAYFPEGDETTTVIRNCHFKAVDETYAYSMRTDIEYPGTYEQVTGYTRAFGTGAAASGTFTDCTGGDASFGGDQGTASGTFTNCTGGDASFGGGRATASGTFTGCNGGMWSFGGDGTASGTFTDCTGEFGSFGGNGGTASGTFTRCTGGESAFGGGSGGTAAGGVFRYCIGDTDSFTTSGSPAPVHLYSIKDGVAYP